MPLMWRCKDGRASPDAGSLFDPRQYVLGAGAASSSEEVPNARYLTPVPEQRSLASIEEEARLYESPRILPGHRMAGGKGQAEKRCGLGPPIREQANRIHGAGFAKLAEHRRLVGGYGVELAAERFELPDPGSQGLEPGRAVRSPVAPVEYQQIEGMVGESIGEMVYQTMHVG